MGAKALPGLLSGMALALAATSAAPAETATPRIAVPVPDAERGQYLFVTKGCVVCHAVNGVGGKAGPALDAPGDGATVEPVDFAARMWRGAAAMIVLQSLEFGYEIGMTGQEIADLAAFAASPKLQATFSEADIPEVMRGWTVDEEFTESIDRMMNSDTPPDEQAN